MPPSRPSRRFARIVTISTLNTIPAAAGIASYLASKAAIEQLTRVAAVELGREASPPTSCRRASPIPTSCGP